MAGAFRFRLATVERVRGQEVERQRRAVAVAARAVKAAEVSLADVTNRLRELTLSTRSAKQGARLDVGLLRSQEFHGGWLADQAIQAQAFLSKQQAELVRRRNLLGDLSKRLKVIEKLRERQWRRFRAEQAKREQIELDEVALQQFVRSARRKSVV